MFTMRSLHGEFYKRVFVLFSFSFSFCVCVDQHTADMLSAACMNEWTNEKKRGERKSFHITAGHFFIAFMLLLLLFCFVSYKFY